MDHARLAELPDRDPGEDGELVARVLAGETAVYAVLLRRYNQRLYRAVRAIIRQDHEAEDVVQQAYVTAFDKLAQFRGDASFGTWLTKIAVHEALGRLRKAGHRRAHLELVDPGTGMDRQRGDPELAAQRRQMGGILERSIDELPDKLRIVFVLRDVEELNTAEAAACLDLSEEAVRVRLHRARSLMREQLSAVLEAAPDAFHFAGTRCDRIVLGVMSRLQPER